MAKGVISGPTVAIRNVCAWPKLIRLEDDTLLVLIFNKPSHGLEGGGVECWGSTDKGETWKKRGVPAPNPPGLSIPLFAAGVDNENLIVLSAGVELIDGKLGSFNPKAIWVSNSEDQGYS